MTKVPLIESLFFFGCGFGPGGDLDKVSCYMPEQQPGASCRGGRGAKLRESSTERRQVNQRKRVTPRGGTGRGDGSLKVPEPGKVSSPKSMNGTKRSGYLGCVAGLVFVRFGMLCLRMDDVGLPHMSTRYTARISRWKGFLLS